MPRASKAITASRGALRRLEAHVRGLSAYAAGPTPRGGVHVWYGHARVPTMREWAIGGMVKLQHLSARYPNEPRCNILYLVTSRLPEAASVLADWARRRGARLVVNQNGVAYPAWAGTATDAINAPMRELLSRADHVFYQSEFCRLSADRFAGPPAAAFEVLYNPVDTSRFVPAPPRQAARTLTLLLAGSQDQWYRFASAVDTLAQLTARGVDARLLITGRLGWNKDPDTARSEADRLMTERRVADRVELVGRYTQADAPAIFQRADIVLHTKYNDPAPTAVLEALSCGCPVVYSKTGGVPELVGDDAGIGIEAPLSWDRAIAPDASALADAVCRVRESLRRYADAARARAVERFDVRQWLDRHRAVFEALVAGHA